MNFKGLLPALCVSGLLFLGLVEPSVAQDAVTALKLSDRLGSVEMSATAEQAAPASLELALDAQVRASLIQRVLLLKGQAMLGVPYAYGSNGLAETDCSGLVGQVFEAAGIALPRASRDMATVGVHVSGDDLQIGDVVIYRFPQGLHAAIYVGGDQILHASPKYGVVKTALDDTWRKHMVTARRVI